MANKEPKIGELDRQIVIQQSPGIKESDGSVTESWSTLATVWAKVEYFNTPTMTSEQHEADKNTATGKVQFTIRYRAGLSKTHRVSFNSQIFDIVAINEVGRREWILLMAESKE